MGTPHTDHRHVLCVEAHPAPRQPWRWADPHCVDCGEPMAAPPAEVWCVNDASTAVGVVDGVSYCATCITYASAGQPT